MTFTPKMQSFDFQAEFIRENAYDPAFALWWEPGLGKSKGIIDNTCVLWEGGEI